MTLNQILALAGVAVLASLLGFLVGSRLGKQQLMRRIGDDAQEWLDSRSAHS